MSLTLIQARQIARTGPILVVVNGRSGHGDTDVICAAIAAVLTAAGREHELFVVEPKELRQTAQRIVKLAQERGGVVVAVGGDGTINTVAHAVLQGDVPFGVLPQGTFNYFGRAHGIPQEIEAATRVLVDGVPTRVQVGQVNERIFLVNASLGLYPQLLEDREAHKARFGRWRIVAMLSAIASLLHAHRRLELTIESEGQRRTLRTLSLFAGNNRLQLEQIGIDAVASGALERGELVGSVLRPIGTVGMLGLILRGAFGRLGDAENVQSFVFRSLRVTPRWQKKLKVGTDGEVRLMTTPLVFSVAPEPLWLLAAPAVPVASGDAVATGGESIIPLGVPA